MSFKCELTSDEQDRISREFGRIASNRYLDHAGATLYSERQIEFVAETLKTNLFSNPHTSKVTADLVDQVRYRILRHFNTDINNYSVVFNSGTTASLKTVAECFDFGSNGIFSYTQDNHTSVLGMRNVVQTKNIFVLTREQLENNLYNISSSRNEEYNFGNTLVTFPAQCNFSGYKYPLELIEKIQRNGMVNVGTRLSGDKGGGKNEHFICLDAACFASTNFLDLSTYKPDFVCISFYKMFGYPSGLGALIVSKRGEKLLKKLYFGGGTVKIAMSSVQFEETRDSFYEKFEDGTLSFLAIISLLEGFKTIERLVPPKGGMFSIQRVGQHVFALAQYCYNELKLLQYENHQRLVKLYTHTKFKSDLTQGGIISFNVLHDDGSFIGFAEISCLAALYNITLRTGCFCNPGACQLFLKLNNDDLIRNYKAGHVCGDYNDLIDGIPTGAVRISFGYMSTKDDVDHLVNMMKECYLNPFQRRLKILQNSNEFSISEDRSKGMNIRLKEICIYPVKSCGAFKTKGPWQLSEYGLKYDRCWMIVNSNGTPVTQKFDPMLCLIKPLIDITSGKMILTFPESLPLTFPLETSADRMITSSVCLSKVCGDLVKGYDCGDEAATWLEKCLGMPGLRLIHHIPNLQKKVNLSNQAQLLLINTATVKWLMSRVDSWADEHCNTVESVTDRFRANLVIETDKEMEENDIKDIKIGDSAFAFSGPCTRCQMICIDQRSGEKTAEPLKTIAREFKGKIWFGIYLTQKMLLFKNQCLCISCNDSITLNKKP